MKKDWPVNSLNHAHSGSDSLYSFNFSNVGSTSPLRAVAILPQSDFHEVSRAAGPKGQPCKLLRVLDIPAVSLQWPRFNISPKLARNNS